MTTPADNLAPGYAHIFCRLAVFTDLSELEKCVIQVPTYYAAVCPELRNLNLNLNANPHHFKLKIGTPVTPALQNVHTNVVFLFFFS